MVLEHHLLSYIKHIIEFRKIPSPTKRNNQHRNVHSKVEKNNKNKCNKIKYSIPILTINSNRVCDIKIIQYRVTYLKLLPDDDPNVDRNMKQSLNKTYSNINGWFILKIIMLTANKTYNIT
jgi:hypothetical protein